MEAFDYLEVPVKVGDTIAFPASGTMMKATVKRIDGKGYLRCINESGNKADKYARDCINVTALYGAYKQLFPENCL
jgi:hypothetical protein